MDRYEIILTETLERNSARDVITTNDRAHAFKRFRQMVAAGEGTQAVLWDRDARECLASAEWSAAK